MDGCTLFNFQGKDKNNNDIINVYELTNENTLGNNTPISTRSGNTTWHNQPAFMGQDFFYSCTDCATQIEGLIGEVMLNRSTSECDDISEFEENVIIDCEGNITVELNGLNTNKYNVGWLGSEGIYHAGEIEHSGVIGDNCYIIESLDGCCNFMGCIEVTEQQTYINTNFNISFSDSYDAYHKHIEFSVIDGQNLAYPITVTYLDDSGNSPCSPDLLPSSSYVSSCSELLVGEHYCVVFEDNNQCTQEYCFTVEGQTCAGELSINLENIKNVCNAVSGAITISVNYGLCHEYTIEWDIGQNGEEINNLTIGNYCVTIQGENECEDCKTVQCFEIKEEQDCEGCTEPLTISSTTEDICRQVWWEWDDLKYKEGYYYSSGLININTNGGCENYLIEWDDGDLSGFERIIYDSGTYCATIFDPCCNEEIHVCWVININYVWNGCNSVSAFKGVSVEIDANQIMALISDNWKSEFITVDDDLYLEITFENTDSVSYDLYHVLLDTKVGKIEMREDLTKNKQGSNKANQALEDQSIVKKHLDSKATQKDSKIISKVSPNPFHNQMVVEINSNSDIQSKLFVYDILGQRILSENIVINKGKNRFEINFPPNTTNGMMTIFISSEGKVIDSFKAIRIQTN